MTTASLSPDLLGRDLFVARCAESRIRMTLHKYFSNQRCGKNPQHENDRPFQHLSLSLIFVGVTGSGYATEGAN